MLNLRHLLYFKTIVEQKSIAAASAVLHIAQPPLSQHIKTLEAEYGLQLFERKGRGLHITEAGLEFYQRACELLYLADEIDEQMRARAKGLVGKVALGTVTSGLPIVAQAMVQLKQQLPAVTFAIHQGEPAHLEDMIHARQLDIALSHSPVITPGLASQPLCELALSAVEALPGLLPEGASCTLADLARCPLILARRREGHGVYERIQHAFARAGLKPKVAFECSDVAGATALAAAGAGVALLPTWAGNRQWQGLRQVAVSDWASEERLVLTWLEERPRGPAVEAAAKVFEALMAQE